MYLGCTMQQELGPYLKVDVILQSFLVQSDTVPLPDNLDVPFDISVHQHVQEYTPVSMCQDHANQFPVSLQ